jgi:hypothetical protein
VVEQATSQQRRAINHLYGTYVAAVFRSGQNRRGTNRADSEGARKSGSNMRLPWKREGRETSDIGLAEYLSGASR